MTAAQHLGPAAALPSSTTTLMTHHTMPRHEEAKLLQSIPLMTHPICTNGLRHEHDDVLACAGEGQQSPPDRVPKAHGGLRCALRHLAVQVNECSATDEQDVLGVHLNHQTALSTAFLRTMQVRVAQSAGCCLHTLRGGSQVKGAAPCPQFSWEVGRCCERDGEVRHTERLHEKAAPAGSRRGGSCGRPSRARS